MVRTVICFLLIATVCWFSGCDHAGVSQQTEAALNIDPLIENIATIEDIDALEIDCLNYCGYLFFEYNGKNVVAQTGSDNKTLSNIRCYDIVIPADDDFNKLLPEMTVFELVKNVGLPDGSYTSGMISLSFEARESGNMYTIYFGYSKNSELVIDDIVVNTKADEEYILTIKSIDEYRTYIEEKVKPEKFISYEMLSDIGEFCTFVPFDMGGVIYQYSYRLKTDNGYISIDISYDKDDSADIVYLESPPSAGFADTDQFKHTAVSYNGIIYIYPDSGELKAVRVILDNMSLTISSDGNESLSKCEFENDNLVTCLLSGNKDNVDIVSRYLTDQSEE